MELYKRGSVWWMDFCYEGKRYRKSTKVSNEADALLVSGNVLKRLSNGEEADEHKESLSLRQLISLYEMERDAKRYVLQFKTIYLESFKGKEISKITRKDLYTFRDELSKRPKQRGGERLTDSTVNRALAGLRRLFHYAMSLEHLKESPFPKEPKSKLLYSERRSRGRRKFFTEADIRKILEICPVHPDFLKPLIITAYLTGCRVGELLKLRWPDILKDGVIWIQDTKAGKPQDVGMQDRLIELLTSLPKRSEYVFSQEDGRPLKHWHYYRPFQKILKAMGENDGRTFRNVRHTTGTHLHLKGASPIDIKDQLRHSDIRVTTNYYVGTDRDHQKKILERLTSTIWPDARA